MQGNDGADERRQVHDQQLIIGRHRERPFHPSAVLALSRRSGGIEVGQQVEHVLQVVHDLVIDGQLALDDLLEVLFDLEQAGTQSPQGGELVRHAGREGTPGGERLDVAEEVFDADLFGFFGFDRGRDVHKRLLRRGAVLRGCVWGGKRKGG